MNFFKQNVKSIIPPQVAHGSAQKAEEQAWSTASSVVLYPFDIMKVNNLDRLSAKMSSHS